MEIRKLININSNKSTDLNESFLEVFIIPGYKLMSLETPSLQANVELFCLVFRVCDAIEAGKQIQEEDCDLAFSSL